MVLLGLFYFLPYFLLIFQFSLYNAILFSTVRDAPGLWPREGRVPWSCLNYP